MLGNSGDQTGVFLGLMVDADLQFHITVDVGSNLRGVFFGTEGHDLADAVDGREVLLAGGIYRIDIAVAGFF